MDFRQGKRFWAALAATFVVLGVGAGLVLAHTVRYNESVSFNTTTSGNTQALAGTVTVGEATCAPNRRMQLVRKQNGPDKVVNEERSDPAGFALLVFPDGLREARYYGRVTPKRLPPKNAHHKHICAGDRTPSDRFSLEPSGP